MDPQLITPTAVVEEPPVAETVTDTPSENGEWKESAD
jgi:hypothetical protein